MTDRVYPAAKPTVNGGAANPSFPATKAQLYGASRPTYRPQPYHHRRSRRRICCTICFWLILIILILLLLIGVAGAVVYLLYRPHSPSFTVTALKLSHFNLTSSTLNSKFNVNVTATNPNKKITFSYDPTTVSIFSGDVDVGDGIVPGFFHREKNTTLLKASILRSGVALENDDEAKLKSSMKSKSGLPLKVKLETKVKGKMGKLKTPKVRIRVVCDGIKVTLPVGKKPVVGSTSNAKCDVNVRFKIWKWTVG
ncbi:hypothetical protein TanjilG_05976 [Lupinus angustifolius]|uniref:Late embryogenesis abundant protein LEA-2 subgroup domain-containing protein n=1 Tax=Lupinus angustifolius TaxID=3871 RepID=A0A4P1RE75_LUPAN|nr:PREDICTED: uncharacterized protein LOC109351261 [Lupinus angustifolius]OIW09000.1 hypothetical protein TanjilG_05976 [Lupinus angustifolius]